MDKILSTGTPLAETGGQQGLAPYDLAGAARRRKKKRKRSLAKRGSAQTLRDYWTHRGHGGPTHFAGAEAIAWGTPGDFNRCVSLVSEHMTPEQAKGYCNLRHKEALGYYPAQHARMERGKVITVRDEAGQSAWQGVTGVTVAEAWRVIAADLAKAFNPSQSRVTSGPQGGQFGAGGGAAAAPAQAGAKPGGGNAAHVAQERTELKQIRAQIAQLEQSLAQLRSAQAKLKQKAGAKKPPKKPGARKPARAAKPAKPGTKKPAKSGGRKAQAARITSQVAQVQSQISHLRAQAAQLQQNIAAGKSVRNVRDVPSGRFRTFQGELAEAHAALKENRLADATELLGSARALARTDQERVQLSTLQESVARVRHGPAGVVEADLAKIG